MTENEAYQPQTLEEALEFIADLEYEIALLENGIQDLRDEIRNFEMDLASANELIAELEMELNG